MVADSSLPNSLASSDSVSDTHDSETSAQAAPRRRFALGRVVKNAAPDPDLVAQIRAAKSAGRDPKKAAGTETVAPSTPAEDDRIEQIAEGLDQMFDLMVSLHDQEKTRDKMFDALYSELHDYKNDFFYERLKPVLQPLLFLLDSIEQYQEEILLREELETSDVPTNIGHFHDQLMEALRIAQMEPMPKPEGEYNPKIQRAVDVVPVAPEQNNQIVRVVRSGWLLNGQPLRPADVVVGRSTS